MSLSVISAEVFRKPIGILLSKMQSLYFENVQVVKYRKRAEFIDGMGVCMVKRVDIRDHFWVSFIISQWKRTLIAAARGENEESRSADFGRVKQISIQLKDLCWRSFQPPGLK